MQRRGPESGKFCHPLRNEGESPAGQLLCAPFPPGGTGCQQAHRNQHDHDRQPGQQSPPFCKTARFRGNFSFLNKCQGRLVGTLQITDHQSRNEALHHRGGQRMRDEHGRDRDRQGIGGI